MQAWLEKTPRALIAANYKDGDVVSLIRIGSRGMNIFWTMGSIPIYLLNEDLPSKAISLTRSVSSSGTVFAKSPPLITFFSMVINSVGNELLLVMSWLGSSLLPKVRTFASIFNAECNAPFLSLDFRSPGDICKTDINLSRRAGSCLNCEAPASSFDCFSNFYHCSSDKRGEKAS